MEAIVTYMHKTVHSQIKMDKCHNGPVVQYYIKSIYILQPHHEKIYLFHIMWTVKVKVSPCVLVQSDFTFGDHCPDSCIKIIV